MAALNEYEPAASGPDSEGHWQPNALAVRVSKEQPAEPFQELEKLSCESPGNQVTGKKYACTGI